MPPKRTNSSDSYSISSASSRIRSNLAADLITKSQAALSSQASIYTQRSITSQQNQLNFALVQHQDIEFNRQEITEVFITRQQEEMIQKILQLARKGKVNSKNAFEIPIKVVQTQANSSVNNKFWKFASQLLDASMYIYDKRVQNMYVSIGAFENKLSRIGFNIQGISNNTRQQQEDRLDDANAQQQMRRDRNREERQMMLKISADEFSGALNLDDSEIIGFQSIQRKQRLDIKNIENKFIADPTFQRTQKLFDSFSLKSLMLNIFNVVIYVILAQLSVDLNVGLFHRSDLEKYKVNGNTQGNTQNCQDGLGDGMLNYERRVRGSQRELGVSGGGDNGVEKQTQSQDGGQQRTQSIANYQVNSQVSIDFGNAPLSSGLTRHLQLTKTILQQQPLLQQITSFIAKQPELRQDYMQRRNIQKRRNPQLLQLQSDFYGKSDDVSYGEIIERERMEFVELFREFHGGDIEREFGDNNNMQANDFSNNNPTDLFQTHETQSENFDQSQSNFLTSFTNTHHQQLPINDYLQTNSMPVSIQQSFFSYDEQSNIIEPIMPWEIQFKNLKLTKKRKKPEKNQSKKSKSNKESGSAGMMSVVDFGVDIVDRKEALSQKDVKKKFENSKLSRVKFREGNCQPKEYDIAHAEYHTKTITPQRPSMYISQRQSLTNPSHHQVNNSLSFVFDLDDSIHPDSKNMKKQPHPGLSQQETRVFDGQTFSGIGGDNGGFFLSYDNSKALSISGGYMGVNNIRQIKKIIVGEVNQKGYTTLEEINKLMTTLSPQQLFTIFLHLTNEHQFDIANDNNNDESTVILSKSRAVSVGEKRLLNEEVEI